jgi:hypothetical protein
VSPDELLTRVHRLFQRGLTQRLCDNLMMAGDPQLLTTVECLTARQLGALATCKGKVS